MTNPFVPVVEEEAPPEVIEHDSIIGDELVHLGVSDIANVRDVAEAPPAPRPIPVSDETVVLYPASGGVGTSTLASLAGDHVIDGGEYLLWEGAPVFVVAATHRAGLDAAAETIRQVARGDLPVELRGLVLVHDRANLPKETVRYARQVAGLFPRTVTVPFIPTWRDAAPTDLASLPVRVRRSIAALSPQKKEKKA